MITHRFSHRDFEEAFAVARSGQSGKVILDWMDIEEDAVYGTLRDELAEPLAEACARRACTRPSS